MATISIRCLPGKTTEFGDGVGEIRIGDFVEEFPMSVVDLSPQDYVAQWKKAQSRMMSEPAKGCFVCSAVQPSAPDGLVFCWVYYRDGDSFVFQNHVLLMSEINGVFDLEDPERWVRPRETVTEDGQRISEWRVPLRDLAVVVGD